MDRADIFDTLQKHLHTFDEVEALLLKGHLVLEQALNQVLKTLVNDVTALERMNLNFARKVEMLAALRMGIHEETIEQLREVNRIRNRLAHNVDFGTHRDILCAWACGVLGHTPKTLRSKRTTMNTIRKAFYLLAGQMSGYSRGVRAVRNG